MGPNGSDPNLGNSGLELDRPGRGPGASGGNLPRTVSNPGLQAVRTAHRSQPLGSGPQRTMSSDRLREGAVDTVLNSVSILGELAADFRSSDRYFKYKVFVLVAWALLSVSSITVACAGHGPSNDIEATLITTGDASSPLYAVKNSSLEPWHDVEILVNGQYRTTQGEVEANAAVALSSAVLFDAKGKRAPRGLRITDIVVKVAEPEADVGLLLKGQPQ